MAIQSEKIKISELFACSADEQEQKVDQLFQAALNPTEAQLRKQKEEIDSRIRNFERRYEMSSPVMRVKLRTGHLKETAEICSWLMLINAREDFDDEPAESWSQSATDLPGDSLYCP